MIHYRIKYCIKGIHLLSKTENIFDKVEIELESLTRWMNSYPVRLTVPVEEDKLTAYFTLSYLRAGEPPSFCIGKGFRLSISPRTGFTDFNKEEVKVQQRYIAVIESTESKKISELLEKIIWLQSFLDMATFVYFGDTGPVISVKPCTYTLNVFSELLCIYSHTINQ